METQSGKSSMWEKLQDKKLISPTNKLVNVQKRVKEGEPTNRKGFRDISGSNFVQIFFNVYLHSIRKCARIFVVQGVSVLERGWLAWCCVKKIPMVGGILSLFLFKGWQKSHTPFWSWHHMTPRPWRAVGFDATSWRCSPSPTGVLRQWGQPLSSF